MEGAAPGGEGEGLQGVGVDGEAQGFVALGEVDQQVAAGDRDHLAGAEVGIVTVAESVAGFPHV